MRLRLPGQEISNFFRTCLHSTFERIVSPPINDFKTFSNTNASGEGRIKNSNRDPLFGERLPKWLEVTSVKAIQTHCFRLPTPFTVNSMGRRFFPGHEGGPNRTAANVRRGLDAHPSSFRQQ